MFAELEELIAPADQTGRFAFADLPAGDYQLLTWHLPLSPDGVRITSNLQTEGRSGRAPEGSPLPLLPDAPTLVASMAISAEKPVADLIVPLAPGARFSGRVVFDGLVGPPPASLLAAAPVRVTEAHGRTLSVPVSGIREDGRFETVGLPPGRYILEVASSFAGAGWSAFFPRPMAMASLRAGGEERIGLGLEIGTADVTDIVMTLTSRRWHLSGLLRGPDGRAAVAAHVVVFPRDRARWADVGFDAPHLLHLATTDRSGRFQLEGAIGGDYLAAAMTAPAEFWMAPEYLETFVPFATPVRLELDGAQTIELRLR
jgi:hypothetical protein